ncbi:leucine-rich repeat protein [Flavobacterium sp. Fl-77]|uniref:Leucine-rich repeat protein n=1 Tax=Flavobacterium flavipigmentatum TaxID=2893884 RepID=A0AAJ2S5D8_9FLAO|nr:MULTISPECIES: leucine-rich repeat protein [unclassified Flavobacterium]MDX6181217.1 leucine-rich repeat protein [Flavobacterium sp. Fl-33]MDX6184818.1 leucine-rich repeat protein [Flavobacterium sp. Fl-77]UFH39915.1 leucine-rich repeat protein [Flavobacterium sp. F-70]
MKQKLLLILAILCVSFASAQTFAVDGINYTVIPSTTEVTVSSGSCYTGDLLLPSMVSDGSTNYTVTSIGDEAFRSCIGLTSISFPSTVTSIGGYSFAEASNLASITMGVNVTSIREYAFADTALTTVSLGSSVTVIGNGVFSGCRSLETVTNIDSVISIGDYAFSSCYSLTSFTFPNSVTTVGSNIFEFCEVLSSVTIGANMTEIGASTFSYCSSLREITIPSNITAIGDYAFSSSGVKSVTIPASVSSIGYAAFSRCEDLKAITIPNSVTSIGNFAFATCRNLEVIRSNIALPITIPPNTFSNIDFDTCILIVPTASVTAYQNASVWQDFTTITDVLPATAVPSTSYTTQVYAGDDKTIGDLQIDGTDILWYDAAKNGNLLENTTVLVDNTKYYASQTLNGIESTERIAIAVKRISDAKQYVATGSTVASLVSSTSIAGKALWFTAETGDNVLNSSDLLSAGTYYVSQEYEKKFTGFSNISDLTVDSAGNIYVFSNNVIKKIALDDSVTILAGNEGVNASINGTGTGARFLNGSHLTMGSDGNIYVAEISAIKKVSLPDAVVTTLATGFSNFGGGIVNDGFGNLYVANTDASRVDKVSETTGVVTTVPNAGDYRPRAVAIDEANNILYSHVVNLTNTHYLRRINLSNNTVTTIGVSGSGKVDGTATTAQFKNITDIAFNATTQTLYVVDDSSIREVDVNLNVITKSLYGGTTKLAVNETGATFRTTTSEVFQYNGLSNRAAVIVDFQPIVNTLLPANSATSVVINSDLKLTFNENVFKGSGNITIYDAADDSVFETIEVTSSNVIIEGALVTINPSLDLLRSKTYYVVIDEPAFKNAASNNFSGIANKSIWAFSTELKLTPAVTFADFSKTYGDAEFDLAATSNSTGLISYEIISGGTGSAILSGTNNTSVTVGNIGTVILKATVASDSNYNQGSKTVTLTISKKEITVTAAEGQTKLYGAADPTLTYSVSPSLVGTDVFTGSLSRVTGENVSTYAIEQNNLSAGSNYTITYVAKDFAITAKPITITATAGQSKEYGAQDPVFMYTSSEVLLAGNSFTGSLGRAANNNAGTYTYTTGDLSAGPNYELTVAGSTSFTITPKAINVTAAAKTKVYGTTDVPLTYSVSPSLLGTDAFTGTLSRATGDNVGTYAIEQGTLSAGDNYAVTFVPANYSITKADQVITWNQTLVSDCGSSASIALTATSTSGLGISFSSSNSNVATIVNNELVFVNPGSVAITASQLGDNNYNAASSIVLPIVNSQPNLIRKQFDNIIFFDNSSNEFVAYTWYKNGLVVAGQTAQYFKETGALNGSYYAVATKKDGTVIRTCPLVLTSNGVVETMNIAPNPVRSNSSYQLITNIEAAKMQNARVTVFNILGSLMTDKVVNESTMDMIAPSAEGIYIVKLTLSNGKMFTKNLLVRN